MSIEVATIRKPGSNFDEGGVRQERTGWRDEDLSQRHRDWGFNCPAFDLDFMMIEYSMGVAVALVEYKRFTAKPVNLSSPTLMALADLGERAGLPAMVSVYHPDWSFRVTPLNDEAAAWFGNVVYSEEEYVRRLYEIRNEVIESRILQKLRRTKIG